MSDTGAHTVVEGIEFKVDPHSAVGAAEKIAHSFEKLHEVAESAKEKLHHVFSHALVMGAGIAGVGFGFHELADKAIEANRELQGVQKAMTGALLSMESWNKAIPIVDRVTISMSEAHEATEKLEEVEQRLAMPITSLSDAFKQLSFVGFKRLGRSQEEVLKMTEETSAAAKVMGMDASQAAMLVERAMLTRAVRGFGPLQDALREALKGTKKLSDEQVWNRINKQLAQFGPAADRMSAGFGDSMFRIKLFFDHTLRDAGAPLFKDIADQLKGWSRTLEEAKAHGEDIVGEVGHQLLTAFRALEASTMFLYRHWKLIGGIWASWKVLGIGARVFNGAKAGGLAGALGGAVGSTVGVMTVKAGIVNVSGGVGGAVGAAEEAAKSGGLKSMFSGLLSKAVFLGQAGLVAGAGGVGTLLGTAGMGAYRHLSGGGRPGESWAESMKVAGADLRDSAGFLAKEVKNKLGIASDAVTEAVNRAVGMPELADRTDVEYKNIHPAVKPAPINNFFGGIHITQDFKDQDPDRVFVAVNKVFEGLADNPKQSNQGSPYTY